MMYSGVANAVSDELSNLHICSTVPQQYSPNTSKKVAPLVPPKPKKFAEVHGVQPGEAVYTNVVSHDHTQTTGMSSVPGYYAVNAPAPGIVGVASARINRSYTGSPDMTALATVSVPKGYDPKQCEGFGQGLPGSREEYAQQFSGEHFSPPLPQPSHSYIPTSKIGIHMGTPQPLYSNIGGQLCHNNIAPVLSDPIYVGPVTPPPSQLPSMYANVGSGKVHYNQMYINADGKLGERAYASYGIDEDFPPPPPAGAGPTEGVPAAPSSPVSSSYSELRRTALPPQAYPPAAAAASGAYAPASQTSSTYESIYEPITPRPSSQMSNRSGSGYGGGVYTSPPHSARGYAASPSKQALLRASDRTGKEAEVDALTSLMVQSMGSSSDPEFFGICARCGEKVLGEGTGCTAMSQVFHIKCFDCIVCQVQLQGKPFYALDSKPYCEDCYMNTLEKCCVCMKPILDRILRATGKPYHPQCFTCVVCHKSLDGILFTVDASNQIHCIDDFHKKFAPRCSVCHEPIMPEDGLDETVRVVALDRSFHVKCYKCEDCGLLLSSEAEGRGCYPMDGHVLCKSCNAKRVQALTSKVTTDV